MIPKDTNKRLITSLHTTIQLLLEFRSQWRCPDMRSYL
jgi:hypothetical protein